MLQRIFLFAFLVFLAACTSPNLPDSRQETSKGEQQIAIVIHGGAGTIRKENMSAELEKQYTDKLGEALDSGHAVLQRGGSSVDAVQAAIMILENSPLFNAGKGAVFNSEGKNELDASIMDGKTLMAGAVAGVTTIKNPIRGAILVMRESPHVMMTGPGAEQFALEKGLEPVDPLYFIDEKQFEKWHKQKMKDPEGSGLERDSVKRIKGDPEGSGQGGMRVGGAEKYGTVGCVALDKKGNLAAGTSTGGMSNKRYGRVGDSPIIGAGTYADNGTCAVSCTGHGEYFIRLGVAKDVSAQMEYRGLSVGEAADNVIHKKLQELGGTGGLIALDARGNIAMPFNTAGMYRGYIGGDGKKVVLLYK